MTKIDSELLISLLEENIDFTPADQGTKVEGFEQAISLVKALAGFYDNCVPTPPMDQGSISTYGGK